MREEDAASDEETLTAAYNLLLFRILSFPPFPAPVSSTKRRRQTDVQGSETRRIESHASPFPFPFPLSLSFLFSLSYIT